MRTGLGVELIRGGVFDPFAEAKRGVASAPTMKLKGASPGEMICGEGLQSPDPADLPLSLEETQLEAGEEEKVIQLSLSLFMLSQIHMWCQCLWLQLLQLLNTSLIFITPVGAFVHLYCTLADLVSLGLLLIYDHFFTYLITY